VLQSDAPHTKDAAQREHRACGHCAARADSARRRTSNPARRAGNSAFTWARLSGVNAAQPSISSSVRPHPTQDRVAASSVQTLVQGESAALRGFMPPV
jgi:hypothetical protein